MIYMITGETQQRAGVGRQRDKKVREARERGRGSGRLGPPCPPTGKKQYINISEEKITCVASRRPHKNRAQKNGSVNSKRAHSPSGICHFVLEKLQMPHGGA